MGRQMLLPLDVDEQERLWRLWEQLPEQGRIELAALFARLIAHAARDKASNRKEPADEVDHR